jgi:hypothetical protein
MFMNSNKNYTKRNARKLDTKELRQTAAIRIARAKGKIEMALWRSGRMSLLTYF